MRSGKSRLLEVVKLLARGPRLFVNVSAAALFRLIEKECPTVLIDEVDGIFKKTDEANADLVSLLNVGWERGAFVPRCVGTNHEVQFFPAFCAKALTGIGE
jgi:hypothetical protein